MREAVKNQGVRHRYCFRLGNAVEVETGSTAALAACAVHRKEDLCSMKKLRRVCGYIPYLTPFSLWGFSKLCNLLCLGSKAHIFVCVLLTFIDILAIIFTIVIDIKKE